MKISTLISSAVLIWAISQTAYGQTFTSSDRQVSLIELYTSEGCSSCPPADKWLNSLKQQAQLWLDYVPIAFHVDYWDFIGWQDPYAHNRHSQRQYRYQANKNIRSVYTPAVIYNGQEWRAWRRDDLSTPETNKAGQLNIDLAKKQLSAQYQSQLPSNQSLVLNIAVLGFDLISKVKQGENSGRTLHHDFVVLGYRSVAMQPGETGFTVDNISLPIASVVAKRKALATWVSTSTDQTPLQATGGWLN